MEKRLTRSPKRESVCSRKWRVQIIAMMKENRWEGLWLQGLFDEPTDKFVDRYKELIAVLRGLKPDIQILEATMTVKVSGGDVNVWCPQVQEYQANQEFFEKRKAAGDRVWVYTCLSPGGPWLNRLLDRKASFARCISAGPLRNTTCRVSCTGA